MHDHQLEAKAIEQALDRAEKILIISHQSPDGDTVGSANAWAELLLQQGKQIQLFCLHPVPANINYLPHSHRYTAEERIFDLHFDLVLVVDSSSLEYAGVHELIPNLAGQPIIINIDHHITNTQFGHHNLVIVAASSTCEIITRLFRHWNIEISPRLANCLLTGIITDTSGLKNPATKHLTLEITAHLIQQGADLYDIYRATHHQKSMGQLQIWGLALSRLQKNQRYNIAITYINDDDLRQLGETTESLEGLANYLAVLQEADVVLVLKQDQDVIRGSFRTPFDHIDVSRLAQVMGGGGHKKAAGFILPGKLVIQSGKIMIE
ncbi:MAG: DHH family phosphoesterase [Candidatus Komeilibacteria bacterium]